MIPTQLFPETSTGALDFPSPLSHSPPPFDCDPTADNGCGITDDELFALLFGPDGEEAVEILKAATEEVGSWELNCTCCKLP